MSVSRTRLAKLEARMGDSSDQATFLRDIGGELVESGGKGRRWAQRTGEALADFVARVEQAVAARAIVFISTRLMPETDPQLRTGGSGVRVYMPDNGRDP